MPIYTNVSDEAVPVKNKSGVMQILAPGESIETWYFHSDSRLNEDSPEPYFPRTPGITKVTASEAPGAECAIDSDTDVFYISQISGSIDVYADVIAEEQQLLKEVDSMAPVEYLESYGTIKNVIIVGEGTCVVTQRRDIPR